MHIQGSGRVKLDNGNLVRLGYAGQKWDLIIHQ